MPCTQLFLNRLQPQLMIFMETELWPNLINQCATKKIKLLLINGRLSAKSLKKLSKNKGINYTDYQLFRQNIMSKS